MGQGGVQAQDNQFSTTKAQVRFLGKRVQMLERQGYNNALPCSREVANEEAMIVADSFRISLQGQLN